MTESVAQRKTPPIYLARGQQQKFQSLIAAEEEEWDARQQLNRSKASGGKAGKAGKGGKGGGDGGGGGGGGDGGGGGVGTFEEYRERSRVAGMV